MQTMRPPIMGTRHVVSAGHYLAAHAAFEILEAGGNAIDAGVAAGQEAGAHAKHAAPEAQVETGRLHLAVGQRCTEMDVAGRNQGLDGLGGLDAGAELQGRDPLGTIPLRSRDGRARQARGRVDRRRIPPEH